MGRSRGPELRKREVVMGRSRQGENSKESKHGKLPSEQAASGDSKAPEAGGQRIPQPGENALEEGALGSLGTAPGHCTGPNSKEGQRGW